MNKKGRMLVAMTAILVQIIISVLYGFSNIQIPAMVCFMIWCACSVMICRVMGFSEVI